MTRTLFIHSNNLALNHLSAYGLGPRLRFKALKPNPMTTPRAQIGGDPSDRNVHWRYRRRLNVAASLGGPGYWRDAVFSGSSVTVRVVMAMLGLLVCSEFRRPWTATARIALDQPPRVRVLQARPIVEAVVNVVFSAIRLKHRARRLQGTKRQSWRLTRESQPHAIRAGGLHAQ